MDADDAVIFYEWSPAVFYTSSLKNYAILTDAPVFRAVVIRVVPPP